jgi:hypothetical protein
MDQRCRTDCEGFYRRDFLKIGAAGLFGLTLPQLLRLEQARAVSLKGPALKNKARSVIQVWLGGGPATIDMWDLKPGAPKEIRGEFNPVDTNVKGIQISEHLPKMAQVMDRVTLVRSIFHTIPSHGTASVWMTTGNKPTSAIQYPSLGSLATRLLPAARGVPPYVTFGNIRNGSAGQAGYLGTAFNPFVIEGAGGRGKGAKMSVRGITLPNNFSLGELENRDKLLKGFDSGFQKLDKSGDLVDGLDAFHRQALEILRSDKTKKAFNLAEEPQALRESYGLTPFGQGALAARRLVEAGVRFVTISLGGWDTHGRNFDSLKRRLLPQLDQTLAALIRDLAERGQLENTVVYCAGEFGRTPKINKNAGRDHWARSMAVVLAGGSFKRGYAHGATDPHGMAPANEHCSPDDVAATVFHTLGLNPHQELMAPSGRPIQLFREGKVLAKLLS